ncbi:MAG: matrixin family metalloprotease [Myxococcales bacterium]|nr:matrixin family metalloprotease [Myxococcales bacterium]
MDAGPRRAYDCTMRSRCLGLWLCLGMLALSAPDGGAFELDRTATGKVLRFARMPVQVYLKAEAPPGLTLAQVEGALRAAIASWNAVGGAKVQLEYGGLVLEDPRFDVYVAFDAKYDLAKGDVTGRTDRSADAGGVVHRTEIRLNALHFKWTTAASPAPGQTPWADLQGVLTHQLGHALGLGHSRTRTATMYFYGTQSWLRSLEPDDTRAARLAWPGATKPAEGSQCDACSTDADCAHGRCLAWPDGSSHCARACTQHDDCLLGSSCGTFNGGQACLPNDGHCRADGARVGLGQACASDLACGAGRFCLPSGSGAFCTEACPCPATAQCASLSVGSVCIVRGPGQFGDVCSVAADCATTVCAPSLAQGGRCSLSCSTKVPCPAGAACGPDSLCSTPGTLAVGWPCESGFDCKTGLCFPTPGGRFARVCAAACKVAGDCPAGTGCSNVTADTFLCLPFGLGVEDGPCTLPGSCESGLLCDPTLFDGVGACRRSCDPYADDLECSKGQRCAFVGPASKAGGACRPITAGQAAGQSCGVGKPCQTGLVCAQSAGVAPTCLPDCAVDTGTGCIGGTGCAALGDSATTGRGVCAEATAPFVEVAAPAALPKNAAARTVHLPDVVPVAAFKPAAPAAAASPKDEGCQAASSPSAPSMPTWIALLGAALVAGACRRGWRRAVR